MTAMAVKYLFYEDMDEVSELRRTYIEELTRSYEAEKNETEKDIGDSYIPSSSVEGKIEISSPENNNRNIGENEVETDEGISVRSTSITSGSCKESHIGMKVSPMKRKHLPSSSKICPGGSDTSSESSEIKHYAWPEINIPSDILKPRDNVLANSDSISSSDVEQEPHPASSISSRRSSTSIHTPTEIRSLEECVRLLRVGEIKNLVDEEILQLLETKHIRSFELEKVLDDHVRGVEVRRKMVMRQTDSSLKGIPYRSYDYEKVLGQCAENVIGYMTLPLGIVGPLKVNDKFYTVPMATTEGCLLASTNRGCSALKTCGVTSVLFDEGMTRAPAVTFKSAVRAAEAKAWIDVADNQATLKVCNFSGIKGNINTEGRYSLL